MRLHLENTMHEWWKQGEWVNYYTIGTSVIEISSSWRHTIGLRLLGVESCSLSNCNALSTRLNIFYGITVIIEYIDIVGG